MITLMMKNARFNQSPLKRLVLKDHHNVLALVPNLKKNNFCFSKSKKNNTEFTESTLSTEITAISVPNTSTQTPKIKIPLQVPTKTIRSNSDTHIDPNKSEKFTSQENTLGVTSHQF